MMQVHWAEKLALMLVGKAQKMDWMVAPCPLVVMYQKVPCLDWQVLK